MHFTNFAISILVFINSTYSIKVNLEGTLTINKDILTSLSKFLRKLEDNTRRYTLVGDGDNFMDIIRTAGLCHDLGFCMSSRKFIDDYVNTLAKSIEMSLSNSLGDPFIKFYFEDHLKHNLIVIRYILQETNMKITKDNESYFWIDTIKKICAKFQEMAYTFLSKKFRNEVSTTNKKSLDKTVYHNLIITTALIELKHQEKLCTELYLCSKFHSVTRSLGVLLDQLQNMPDEKVRLFIRYFYEGLSKTNFYLQINQITAHELQVSLHDMAYSKEVPTKEILSAVTQIIDLRVESNKINNETKLSNDNILVHCILSDMDHFYNRYKEPFGNFFKHFHDWKLHGIEINRHINDVLKNISKELSVVPDDLILKVTNEMKTFLEMTVDPVN